MMKRILIVDDSSTIRRAIRRIVESLGYYVVESEDGERALWALRSLARFDVVLCDIDMPNMDGLAFLAAVRESPDIVAPPIIMCTTHTAFDRIQSALGLGASEYIMKPFDADIISSKFEVCGLS
jgi:two-component system, chemotaxis family, chemotaxis protein CheY